MKRLYIFDLGNVCVTNISITGKCAEILGISHEDFLEDYKAHDMAMMAGLLEVPDYYRHVEEKWGVKVPGDIFRDTFAPIVNRPVIDMIDALRARGDRVVMGSNTFAPHWPLVDELDLRRHYDTLYASHLIKAVKPYASFFTHIMYSEGFRAEDTSFVDDYEENIGGAAAIGIDAIHYTGDNDALRSRLGL